jgi:glycosyltransferase involved in cell wall biosynthesis
VSNPIISIIVPSYNAGNTISKALESIRRQTFSDFETLVIDGMSKDETNKAVEAFTRVDERFKFYSEKDDGIYDAMNKGVKRAKGTWLYFLGADDELYNNDTLLHVVKRLLSTKAKMVYGDVRLKGDSPWAKSGDIYGGSFTIEKLFRQNICHQSIFYQRDVFNEVGLFNTEYATCADWDLNHRCFAKMHPEYLNQVIANFSGGGTSSLKPSDKYVLEDCLVNLKRYYNISYLNPLFKTYDWLFFLQSRDQLLHKRFVLAFKYFIASFWHSEKKWDLLKAYLRGFKKLLFQLQGKKSVKGI